MRDDIKKILDQIANAPALHIIHRLQALEEIENYVHQLADQLAQEIEARAEE